VAGLARALEIPAREWGAREAMEQVMRTLREVDPLRFRKIRWSERAVDRWLDLSLRLARDASGQPARLFEALEAEFERTTKWEAQVPFVVVFSCFELADHDPLAALQLTLEWGHDTDSYASVAGAFAGALYGANLFAPTLLQPVVARLHADHGIDLEEESRFLARLAERGARRTWVKR